jgi:DNA-binding protein HU-beta
VQRRAETVPPPRLAQGRAAAFDPLDAAVAAWVGSRGFFSTGSPQDYFILQRSGADMNKSELAQALANKTEMSKTDAQRAIDAIFGPEDGVITQALKAGDRVQITGFGTFETRERKARTGRNPRTGREIRIGPTTSASFRPGKALKDAVKPA